MASKRFSVRHRAAALRAVSVLLVLFVSCALLVLWGCGSGGGHAIKVSLASSASGSTVDAGSAAITITATVANDSKNGGVTFSLSPSTGCGSIPASPTGMSVVYTPQPAATLNADCTATITATSVSSGSSKSTLNLTVKAITVSFVNPPTTTTLTAGAGPITLTAAFAHDTATDTVKWSISSGCGELEPNGTAAVYTPPSTSLTAQCKATIAAASTVNPNLISGQTASIVFTVNPFQTSTLVIDTTSLPGGVVNVAYSAPLKASGGTPPYAWSVASSSSLPSWLSLSSTGTLSGTPTVAGTSNFTVKVTDTSTPNPQSKTQDLSVTVAASAAACGSGSESALNGQYAFSLKGYNSSGFLAAIGSFTADGSGHITAGIVDSNGALGVKSGNITASSSSYSVGSDNRGCATIVTPFYTFTTRFALEPTFHQAGNIEEWEPGPTPYIASGEILKQTVPSALPAGVWVYEQSGVYGSAATRTGVVGTLTASGSGTYTAGEYDSNEGGTHHSYTGLTGTYGAPDSTTGRYTVMTTLSGISAHRAEYLVSSTEFLELTTDATSLILVGKGQLQMAPLTITGNLVYYSSGMVSNAAGSYVQIGNVTVTGTSTLTAKSYTNDAGTWSPSTWSCNYAIDSYGKVTTSGTNCGTYSPVIYLTGPNRGVMIGTDPGASVGRADAQLAKSISAGTYYFGTRDVVNHAVETTVGSAALTGTSVSGLTDTTSASAPEQGGQTLNETITVNSDGTFSTSDHPGVITGIVISTSQLVIVNNQGSAYPTVMVINTVPTA